MGPKYIKVVEKMAHRFGTFFGLPNHFHLTQYAIQTLHILRRFGFFMSKI